MDSQTLPAIGSQEWRELPMETKFPNHQLPTFKNLATPDKIWGLGADSRRYLQANYRRVVEDVFRIFISMKSAPPCLWGPPGSRKTHKIEGFDRETDENGVPYQVIVLQPSTDDPTIIHGIKYTSLDAETGETIMNQSIPDVAKQIINYWLDHHGLTILFMDEMTTCMPSQQNALLGVLTHGRYGGLDISSYVSIVMAANPESTVSTVHPLSEAVINRGAHIPWFGDVDLFLEEWRSGFNGAIESPSSTLNWYMTSLIMEQPSKAFRSKDGGWEPTNLVPYDLFDNSERSMTEWNKAIGVVMEIFESVDDSPSKKEVRQHYLVEVTRAILGETWADAMEVVAAKESEIPEAKVLVDQVVKAGVAKDWDHEKLRNSLERFWSVGADSSKLRLDQMQAIAIELVSTIKDHAELHHELLPNEFMTLWAMIQLAPSDDRGSLHSHLVSIMMIALKLLKNESIEKADAKTPDFVDPDIKSGINQALKRYAMELNKQS